MIFNFKKVTILFLFPIFIFSQPSPNIVLEQDYISFGTVMDGLTKTEVLQIANDGDVPLLISSVYIEGSSSFTIEDYSESIAENETGSISVKFSPDEESDFIGFLFIMCNDPDTDMVIVSLNGTGGEQAPVLSLSDDELYFGRVQPGTTVEREVVIYNEGVLELEIEEVIIDGSDFYTTTFSDATIESGNSTIVPFSFTPTDEVTEVIAAATISSNIGVYTIELIAGYFGPVWHISTTGSDDTGDGSEDNPYATIQKGVDESSEGDTVLVDSGTYSENIQIIDKRITLTSYLSLYPENTDIIKSTIIDGSNEGVVINIGSITYQNEYDTLEVKGFTISNGVGTEDCETGEGISSFSYVSPLIVQNCVMISNDEDNCNISWKGDIVLNKVTMRKLAIVGYYPWHVIANNSIIYGSIVEPGGDYPNIYDISYSLLPLFWEGEGNIVADPLFCDTLNGNFSLAENSPAVGSGENGTDIGALSVGCDAIDLSLSDAHQVPMAYTLYQNYPNPFNPVTTLRYDLPENGFVNITVYDMLGNMVNNLVSKIENSGSKSIQWNATNNQGQPVSAGVYLYSIEAGDFRQTKKMILLK